LHFPLSIFVSDSSRHHSHPHSFPTRRSSDLSNPRSTVGTITEVYDYLRVLYARAGEQRCVDCGKPVKARSPGEIARAIAKLPSRSEEHTSELQSRENLVCRLLLEKKKKNNKI